MAERSNHLFPWMQSLFEGLIERNQAKQLPHAILFVGEWLEDTEQFLTRLTRALLCQSADEKPCGQCKSCLLFQAGSHPDLLNVTVEEGAKRIKIDQVRAVIEFDTKKPQIGQIKVIAMTAIETMNANSANALLKCLEEPSPNTLLLLQSNDIHQVLPTILSRCQKQALPKPSLEEAHLWLSKSVSEKAHRDRLLSFTDGNPLKAQQYYEDNRLLALDNYADQLIRLMQGEVRIVELGEKIIKDNPNAWLDYLQTLCITLSKVSAGGANDQQLSRALVELTAKEKFSELLYPFFDCVNEAKAETLTQSNPNMQLLIESLLYRWAAFTRKLLR
ncbi:MAG: hypothetical protein OXE99_08335 [Cellvibrionales bacterium]|nr:hypothetical protein [Cellvibrionales bacterium]